MRILFIIILLFITIDNFACSCRYLEILKNKKSANYVFKGRVTEINENIIKDTLTGTKNVIKYRRTHYIFDIIRDYKGLRDEETVELFSGMTDCERHFEKNKIYIVYAYIDNRKLHYNLADQKTEPYITTHLCSGTKKKSILTFWESFILLMT